MHKVAPGSRDAAGKQHSILCFTSKPSSTLLSRGMEEEDEEEGLGWDMISSLLQTPELKHVPIPSVFLAMFH